MKKKLLFTLLFCGVATLLQAQWSMQASGFPIPNRGIKHLCAVDTNVIWATAYDGSVANAPQIQEFTRTTNGGAKWKYSAIPGYSGHGLSMISAVDSMNAWIPLWYSTGGGTILHTADGGATWTPQTTATFDSPNGFPNVVHFWNVNEGFCMGDPNGGYFEIYTTVDGGVTWTRVPEADIPPNSAQEYGTTGYYDVVDNVVWFTTNKGRIYKSIDKGYHWTVGAIPNVTDQMQISFRDINYGIVRANMSPYNTYFTNDGGDTWQQLFWNGNFYNNDFCYVPGTTNTFISAGADYTNNFMGTSISTDGGLNWNVIPLSDTTQFLTIDFVDVNHGWAGAFNTDSITGGMWKYTGNLFVQDPCAGLVALYVKSADTLDLNVFGVCDFTDLSSGSPSGWSWDFGDGGSANVQNPSHTYTATGTYDIELTVNRDTCVEVYTESIVVINTSGISTFSDGPAVEIWPNPATDYLHIASAAEVYRVEIYNSIGQTAINSLNNEKLLNINISDYLPGVYFVRITTSQGRTEGRFIITK